MDHRAPDLHPSALSPLEYKAFSADLYILRQEDGADKKTKGEKKISKVDLKTFAVNRLKCSPRIADDVLFRMPTANAGDLTPGEIFAVLRLLAHMKAAERNPNLAKRGVEMSLVFVPTEPLPLDPVVPKRPEPPVPPARKRDVSAPSSTTLPPVPKIPPMPEVPMAPSFSRDAATRERSRMSLPARYTSNPFSDNVFGTSSSPDKEKPSARDLKGKNRALSVSDTGSPEKSIPPPKDTKNTASWEMSNNPFRQRRVSVSTTSTSNASKPKPPLPPRKSMSPSLIEVSSEPATTKSVPRKVSTPPQQKSSYRSTFTNGPGGESTGTSPFLPSSSAAPSPLIQQALFAAEKEKSASSSKTRLEPTVHVIRQSSSSHARRFSSSSSSSSSSSAPDEGDRQQASHRNTALIAHVSNALKESEENSPKPPPRRSLPTSSTARTPTRAIPASAKKYMDDEPGTRFWSCVDLIQGVKSEKPYAMIILNVPITRRDIFLRAWSACELHYCADGGTNRLYDLFNEGQRASYMPTMIKGDLDSIRSDVQDYYAHRGVSIKYDGSEYSTDLMKCLEELEMIEKQTGREYNLVFLGGLSGRVDQTVHTMSMMYKLRKKRPNTFVLSSESLAWVMDEGSHLVELDHSTMGQTCGILPLGVDSAHVKTEGLKWNLDWPTSLDGDVSTSNHLLPTEPLVYLTTSRPIMWCIEIKPSLPAAAARIKAVAKPSITKDLMTLDPEESDMKRQLSSTAEGVKGEIARMTLDAEAVSGTRADANGRVDGGGDEDDGNDRHGGGESSRNGAGWTRLE